jgi:hypothetical protein
VGFLDPTKTVLQRWLQAASELTGTSILSALKVAATLTSVASKLQSFAARNLWKTRNVVDIEARILTIKKYG